MPEFSVSITERRITHRTETIVADNMDHAWEVANDQFSFDRSAGSNWHVSEVTDVEPGG